MGEETTNTLNNNETHTNAGKGMGIAALVLGIIGVIASFTPCFAAFAVIFGGLAIIFGAIGLYQASKKNGKKGLPIAGLVLGILATLFAIIWVFVMAAGV